MEYNTDFFRVKHSPLPPVSGRVLIAQPGLADFYFKRAVVLLVEHNEKGTVGFVLNHMVEIDLHELIPEFPEFPGSVSIGGPVSPNSFHFAHTLGTLIPNTQRVADGLYWGGDLDALRSLIALGRVSPGQVRFFLGYSGWSPNQLARELREESWVVTELDRAHIMSGRDELWGEAVRLLGSRYKPWTIYPENPSLN